MKESLRRKTYLTLEGGFSGGRVSLLVDSFLILLILLNLVGFMLQTMPEIKPYWFDLRLLEAVSVLIFTAEYGLRLWASTEDPIIREMGPWRGRLFAATRPMMVIDFLAVAPVYFSLLFPVLDLRFLRMVRLIRLMKIARYSPALSTLGEVIVAEKRALFGTFLILCCTALFSAAAMHAVESVVQPKNFGTLPDALWWAITTLTTVGYGDAVPVTGLGRIIAGLTMIAGMGILALPVGIVATGYINTIHRRDFVVSFGMLVRMSMFRGLQAHILSDIMNVMRAQSVTRREVVAVRGAPAKAMYFIVSGELEAEFEETTLRFQEGTCIGEQALLHQTARSATIIAATNTRLLSLSADDVAMLVEKYPVLKSRLENAHHQPHPKQGSREHMRESA